MPKPPCHDIIYSDREYNVVLKLLLRIMNKGELNLSKSEKVTVVFLGKAAQDFAERTNKSI